MRGFLIAFRNSVKGRVIAIHVHVQPFDGVAEDANMADLGLRAQEFGKGVERVKISDRIDAALDSGIDRIFQHIQPAKIGFIQVGGLAGFEPLVEIAQEIILQPDLRDAGGKADDDHRNAKQQAALVADHELAKPNHETVNRSRLVDPFDGQPADQPRQQEDGEYPDADHAGRHHIAKLLERRRDREIQRQEADPRGEDGDRDAKPMICQRAACPFGAVRRLLHRLAD